MFAGKMFTVSKFFLRERIFADRGKNRKNRKNWNPKKFRATRQSMRLQLLLGDSFLEWSVTGIKKGRFEFNFNFNFNFIS